MRKGIWTFFRSKGQNTHRGVEGAQVLLKKAMGLALRLLLLTSLFFAGHWIYVRLLEDPLFRVRTIEVEGCAKIPAETIRSLIAIESMPNLFAVRLSEIVKRVETHPWVESVIIRKVFPNRIKVQIEERRPLAILLLDAYYYIDGKGVIFSPVRDRDSFNYPFLTGLTRQALDRDREASQALIRRSLEVLKMAERERGAPLEEISEIHMSASYGIDCYSKAHGLEIKMGREISPEKLRRLAVVWGDLQKKGLSAMSIDCSDLNRMIVKKSHPG